MQRHQSSEDVEKQTVPAISQLSHENATQPLHAQEEEAEESHVVEPQAVTDLLSTAEQQNDQRRRLAFLSLCFAIPIALIAAFPGSPLSILSYLFTVFLVTFTAGRFALRYRKTTLAL